MLDAKVRVFFEKSCLLLGEYVILFFCRILYDDFSGMVMVAGVVHRWDGSL